MISYLLIYESIEGLKNIARSGIVIVPAILGGYVGSQVGSNAGDLLGRESDSSFNNLEPDGKLNATYSRGVGAGFGSAIGGIAGTSLGAGYGGRIALKILPQKNYYSSMSDELKRF